MKLLLEANLFAPNLFYGCALHIQGVIAPAILLLQGGVASAGVCATRPRQVPGLVPQYDPGRNDMDDL